MNTYTNILFAGEGGQGVQKIAQALNIALSHKYFSTYINSFGVEQRGAPSLAFIRFSEQNIYYPRFEHADICLIMNSRSIKSVNNFISANTEIYFDSSVILENELPDISNKIKALPVTKIAHEKFSSKSLNIILFGVICNRLEINKEISWNAIIEVLGKKFDTNEILKQNKDAFLFGYEAVLEKSDFTNPSFETKKSVSIYKNSSKKASIVPTRCKGCLICVLKCPVKALSAGEDLGVFSTPVPKIDLEKCIACGNCRRFCPDSAISVDKL